MKLTIAGRTYEIEYIHEKNDIVVMIEQDGRAIVSYKGKSKYYICNKSKAREMWAKA